MKDIIIALTCFSLLWVAFILVDKIPKQIEPEKLVKSESVSYIVTAYCPCEKCCGPYADGITASGYLVKFGGRFCAAKLPFCTVLDIPGHGVTVVLDRGPKIGYIDIYFSTHQEALEWGVQCLEVEVIK